MNATVERVVELCELLGTHAERLDALRCSSLESGPDVGRDSVEEALWGGTLGAGGVATARPTRWYHALDPYYETLDGYIRSASRALCNRVLSDTRVLSMQSNLYRLRAAYEYDKEMAQAQTILAKGNGCSHLHHLVEKESYWALGPELRKALSGSRHVLVAGSGPLPLSALSIASALGARITCVEQDPTGYGLGKRLVEASGHADAVRSIEADIVELQELEHYDAVLGVVLLGVDVGKGCEHRKAGVVEHVLARLRPGARFVFREPHGLGRLLYPSVEVEATDGIEVTRWMPSVGPEHPYRSALVVARRRADDSCHAH